MMTLKNARKICSNLIKNQYPGYVLLTDTLGPKAYLSVWARERERIEIAFSRRVIGDNVKANVAHYKII